MADERPLAVRQVSELNSHSKDSFGEEMADGPWPVEVLENLAVLYGTAARAVWGV